MSKRINFRIPKDFIAQRQIETVSLEIRALRPNGISRNTLDLVVAEVLRQLGVETTFIEKSTND